MDLWSDDEAGAAAAAGGPLSVRSPLLAPRSVSVDSTYSPRNSSSVSRLSPSWEAVSHTDDNCEVGQGEGDSDDEEEVAAPTATTDGLYAWFVCLCAFCIHFALFGFLMGFGVFIGPISQEFDVGTGTVSWAISIGQAVMLSIGFFTGLLADRAGPRWVVFTGGLSAGAAIVIASLTRDMWQMVLFFSLPLGVGMSFSILPVLSLVSQWFTKRRGLATGLAVAGSGMGTLFFPLIAEYLVDKHGWRWTFRIVAEGVAITILLSSLFLKRRIAVVRGASMDVAKYFKKPFLWIMIAAVFCTSFGYMIPYVHVITYAEEQGIETLDAALIVSTMGLASTFGRVGMGLVADKVGKLQVMRLASLALALDAFSWFFCTTLPALLVFGAIYGFVSGALITVLAPLCADYFGLDSLTSMMGIVFSGAGLGFLLGPPISGYTYDITGSFNIAIVASGSSMLVGFVFFCILRKPKRTATVEVPEPDLAAYDSVRQFNSAGTVYMPSGTADWTAVKALSPTGSVADISLGSDSAASLRSDTDEEAIEQV